MKVCVYGLWHLGSVTAACLASVGHDVSAFDPSEEAVHRLRQGISPVSEPGLADLLATNSKEGRLKFHSKAGIAVAGCRVLWVTFDTPVDDDDRADPGFVIKHVKAVLPLLDRGCVILISSQVPVGTCGELEQFSRTTAERPDLAFAYSPENLRLGNAIEVFKNPDRVLIGIRGDPERQVLEQLITPLSQRIEWMSVESAEMTKHALNGFLALSVTFANEIAGLCERVGADAKEVERGLKSERRIGPGAYLSPGPAFAGGTLARDVAFLNDIAATKQLTTPLLSAIRPSNTYQASWPERKLREAIGEVKGRRVAIWGLTYKPGTDTLRRSSSLELCRSLAEQGAEVCAYDPAIQALSSELKHITLGKSAAAVAEGAAALVIMTPWPDFRQVDMLSVIDRMAMANVLDPGRVLSKSQREIAGIRYFAVGTAQQRPMHE